MNRGDRANPCDRDRTATWCGQPRSIAVVVSSPFFPPMDLPPLTHCSLFVHGPWREVAEVNASECPKKLEAETEGLLEAEVEEAIATCGGDVRAALRATPHRERIPGGRNRTIDRSNLNRIRQPDDRKAPHRVKTGFRDANRHLPGAVYSVVTITVGTRFQISQVDGRDGYKSHHPARGISMPSHASVEQLLDPSLRGKPIAVGGGVVLAASYEAKAWNSVAVCRDGGLVGLCPQLIFVAGHFPGLPAAGRCRHQCAQ